jgi:hypothetical protein
MVYLSSSLLRIPLRTRALVILYRITEMYRANVSVRCCFSYALLFCSLLLWTVFEKTDVPREVALPRLCNAVRVSSAGTTFEFIHHHHPSFVLSCLQASLLCITIQAANHDIPICPITLAIQFRSIVMH